MTIRVPEPNAAFAEVIILLPVSLPTKEPLGKSHLVCKCCLGYQISTCSTSEHSRGGLSQPRRYNKGQGSLQTTDIHSPQFWRLAGLAPGESLLPGLQVAACCVLTWRGEDALASLLIRTLISSWGFTFMVSSKPAHSPRAPSPNITSGVRASTYGFWGDIFNPSQKMSVDFCIYTLQRMELGSL